MDPLRGRGARKTGSGGASNKIDARPSDIPSGRAAGPRNVMQTKVFQDGSSGLKRIWANYTKTLKESFRRMPRAGQEQLITQISMIVTLGTTVLLLSFFYGFLPTIVRVLGVPLIGIAAWWAGTRIVAPIMIGRYEEYLNRE